MPPSLTLIEGALEDIGTYTIMFSFIFVGKLALRAAVNHINKGRIIKIGGNYAWFEKTGIKYVAINATPKIGKNAALIGVELNKNIISKKILNRRKEKIKREIIYLKLLNYDTIEQLDIIGRFSNLRYLYIANSPVSDLSALGWIGGNLVEISIINGCIQDIAPFKVCSALKKLNLTRNQIKDIEEIKNCKGIEELYLSLNLIEDTAPLNEITGLVKLSLNDNHIKKLILDKCSKIKEVNIAYNPIIIDEARFPPNMKRLTLCFSQYIRIRAINLNMNTQYYVVDSFNYH